MGHRCCDIIWAGTNLAAWRQTVLSCVPSIYEYIGHIYMATYPKGSWKYFDGNGDEWTKIDHFMMERSHINDRVKDFPVFTLYSLLSCKHLQCGLFFGFIQNIPWKVAESTIFGILTWNLKVQSTFEMHIKWRNILLIDCEGNCKD